MDLHVSIQNSIRVENHDIKLTSLFSHSINQHVKTR